MRRLKQRENTGKAAGRTFRRQAGRLAAAFLCAVLLSGAGAYPAMAGEALGPASDTEIVKDSEEKAQATGPAMEAEGAGQAGSSAEEGAGNQAGSSVQKETGNESGSSSQEETGNEAGSSVQKGTGNEAGSSTQEGAGNQPEGENGDGLVMSGGRQLDLSKPMVALTFDDGPYAPVGNRIMDCMEKYNGRATFFVVGNRVNAYQDEIRRMQASGHEIGNHSYSHKYLQKLGAAEIRNEIEGCNQAVAAAAGAAPALVRLPGGSYNASVLSNIHQPIILWNIDTRDWATRNADQTAAAVLGKVKDGDIVLMHELYKSTADAAERIIPALSEQGFQLVTVSELIRLRGGAAPGTIYYNFPPV